MAKGKKTGGRDFKPGQITNPKGRPKDAVTIRQLKRAFNHNFVQMAEVFKKYTFLSALEFNKVVKESQTKAGQKKYSMVELIAIKFLGEAFKRGHSKKLELVIDVVTGVHGGGVYDVEDTPMENMRLSDALIAFQDSADSRRPIDLSHAALKNFLTHHAVDMSDRQLKVMQFLMADASKTEQSNLRMVRIDAGREFMQIISDVLKNAIGRTNPRLLQDVLTQIMTQVDQVWGAPQAIEVEATVHRAPGRPKGSKNKQPKKTKKKGK